jgi:lysophospholipase L1-like esterase
MSVLQKFSKHNVIDTIDNENERESVDSTDGPENAEDFIDEAAIKPSNSSRPFEYIGDIDPTKPRPWPKEEEDWWKLHEKLVRQVRESDKMPARHLDDDYLPQLVFYGDSITEGWNGTSFGNIPGPTRMWEPGESVKVRQVFHKHFGESSAWGRRALLPPLVLGISGSRTYDFIWRIENGEFPTSSLIATNVKSDSGSFELTNLERIYIVLIGTNNLGGGMLPDGTIAGMDAAGRKILQLIQDSSPSNAPAGIVFSELLPRKDDFRAVKMCPPRCKSLTTMEPYTSFMPAINKVNKALPNLIHGWVNDFPNARIVLLSSQNDGDNNTNNAKNTKSKSDIRIIPCGNEMFAFDNEQEFDKYMPDRLHPNAQGYDVWARCLKRGLKEIMDHTMDLL